MPLAHLLMPQLARKAQEIEDAIGPPRPVASGYLQAAAPPTASDKAQADLRAYTGQQRLDTIFKNGARRALPGIIARGKIGPIPNAPSPTQPVGPQAKGGIQVAPDEPIGMNEDGTSIYASEPAPKPVKKKKGERTVIALPAGPVGSNERGQAVGTGGNSFGYLQQQDPNVRTLQRRRLDVSLGEKEVHDAFGTKVLQQRFGEHLKAMQDNRAADGMPTDKFPAGYFGTMSKRAREEIEKGVKALQDIERGTPI